MKKVDPEVLILNLNKNLDYDLSDDDYPDSEESDDHKTDLYVFAGYVPPGKHSIVIRDLDNTNVDQTKYTTANNSKRGTVAPKHKELKVIQE